MSQTRDKAWREFQDKLHHRKNMGSKCKYNFEKKWKFIYGRSEKIHRAKQLGFEYPVKNIREILLESYQ